MKVKYSFITPRKKFKIDNFTILAIGFIVLISSLLFLFGLYLNRVNNTFDDELRMYKNKILAIQQKEKNISQKINKYIQIVQQEKSVIKSNQSLKNGLKNFFVLIPDQIKIKKLYLTKYEVKIYGETDSPKTYKLLLEPPLKSIFDKTKVGFTKVNSNKYLFSSLNQIKGVKHE